MHTHTLSWIRRIPCLGIYSCTLERYTFRTGDNCEQRIILVGKQRIILARKQRFPNSAPNPKFCNESQILWDLATNPRRKKESPLQHASLTGKTESQTDTPHISESVILQTDTSRTSESELRGNTSSLRLARTRCSTYANQTDLGFRV